ncbi:MAG: hypothetical protein KAT15_00275, partial [Bacteroidales bacterium]|nr:hypothetical protein [Bacteroidales bacterium]
PHNDLLGQREKNEAYCRAVPGKDYLVYFPNAGEVELELGTVGKSMSVNRLEILTGEWKPVEVEKVTGSIVLESPGKHFIFEVQNR